eukprot:gene2619-3312_t
MGNPTPPSTSAGGQYTVTAEAVGDVNTTVFLTNLTFGDVWYCGGQSNKALPLVRSLARYATRDAVLAGRYSNIRIHALEGNMNPDQGVLAQSHTSSACPSPCPCTPVGMPQPWATLKQALAARSPKSPCHPPKCPPVTSDISALMAYSAVPPLRTPYSTLHCLYQADGGPVKTCYYFGESLTDTLATTGTPPPIGLIHTAWGGSAIEQWLTNDTVASCQFAPPSPANQEWHDTRVLPYTSMTVKGWTWYQGENDCHNVLGNSQAKVGYSCLMQALVSQWRALWSVTPGTTDSEAPFGVVTLATTGSEGASGLALGSMRLAQTAGYGAYDLDDEWQSLSGGGPCMSYGYNQSSPYHACCGPDQNASLCTPTWQQTCKNMCAAIEGTHEFMGGLHPRSKRPVGQRLATAAANLVYGGKGAYTGPTLSGCTQSQTSLQLDFAKDLLRGDQ